jgi:peptidoglycan/LPS O-acetylase OafA/YrhL
MNMSGHNSVSNDEPHSFSRVHQLDVLRGLAILLVLLRHAVVGPKEGGFLLLIVMPWHRIGWSAVDLFFILSGFLIGSRLLREISQTKKLDVKRFYIRRIFKIWPAYYVAIFICLCLDMAGGHSFAELRARFITALIHLQNYGISYRSHMWSLSVEEHFYLLLPIVLLVIARVSTTFVILPVVAIVVAVGCLALRIWACTQPSFDSSILYQTQYRLDAPFFGVFLAYLYVFHHDKFMSHAQRHRTKLGWIAFLLLVPFLILPLKDEPTVGSIGLTMTYVGYGVLLTASMAVAHGKQGLWDRLLYSQPMRLIGLLGTYSYGIYLLHSETPMTLGHAVLRTSMAEHLPPELRWFTANGVYLALSIAIGVLLTKCVELPLLALRNRLFPARSAPVESENEPT